MTVHKNQPLMRRFRFAFQGLAAAWRTEANFRIQLVTFLAVAIVLAVARIEPIWWALVLLTSGAVLAAELFNTALEHLADHLHPQTHPKIQILLVCVVVAVLLLVGAVVVVGFAFVCHLGHR